MDNYCDGTSQDPELKKSEPVAPRRAQRVVEILSAISENFSDPHVSMGLIAKKCGISRRYLTTLMRGFGSTYSSELMARRLDAAKLLLQTNSDLLVKQVAYDTGFKSVAHFSASYKRRFGHAPRLEQAECDRHNFALSSPSEAKCAGSTTAQLRDPIRLDEASQRSTKSRDEQKGMQ